MLIKFVIIENWSSERYEMTRPESVANCMSSACSTQLSAESMTKQRLSGFIGSCNPEAVDSIAL
jgi:hypothetical protein